MAKTRTDIAIIGQGLAGSLLAWELWKRGAGFRIFDPGHGNSASAAAGGLYYPLAARKIKRVENLDEQLPVMLDVFREMEEHLGRQFLYEMDSLKLVSDEQLSDWERAKTGPLEGIIKDTYRNITLPGIKSGFCGVLTGSSGFADLPGFIASVRAWLTARELLIPEKAAPENIHFRGNRFLINGTTEAGRLIFCEGTSAGLNPHTSPVEIRKNKGELIEIYAPGLQETYIIKGEVFLLPLGDGRFRVGATYSHDLTGTEPTAAGLAELTTKLEKLIDVPYTVTSHRAGLRPTTFDRQPVIGPLPGNAGAAILNGFGSRGVLQAPWYAEKLASWMAGGESLWPVTADVRRFDNHRTERK